MNKIFLVFILFFLSAAVYSQSSDPFYTVYFSDKLNSPYSISNPDEFLSERSLKRRTDQNIQIQYDDIPVNQIYVDQILNLGANYHLVSKWLNVLVVQCHDSLLNDIKQFPYVDSVIKVKPASAKQASGISKAQSLKWEEGFQAENGNWQEDYFNTNFYYASYVQNEMLGILPLHDQNNTGNGKMVAVLDGGFISVDNAKAFNHLWESNRIIAARDFVNPADPKPFSSSTHGTSVLSIMAMNLPQYFVGSGPGASYLLVKTEDVGTEYLIEEYNWLAGAEYADSIGADIINSSLSYTDFDDSTQNHTFSELDGKTTIVAQAANYAFEKGIIVVASAGNYGNDAWMRIGSPADADNAIAVGAVDSVGNFAEFSSHGPSADGDVKPDVTAQGYLCYFIRSNSEIGRGNGTSFSGPLVSGAIASLWSAVPNATAEEIKKSIILTGSQYLNPDSLLGYGIPDFYLVQMILERQITEVNDSFFMATISPNPFIKDLSINYYTADENESSIELYDMSGKKVYHGYTSDHHKGINTAYLKNLSWLKNGVYLLRLTSGSKIVNFKVIKE